MKLMYSGAFRTCIPAGNWMSTCPSEGIGLPVTKRTVAFSTCATTPESNVTAAPFSDATSNVRVALLPWSMSWPSAVRVFTSICGVTPENSWLRT